jgi:hypothetical protein
MSCQNCYWYRTIDTGKGGKMEGAGNCHVLPPVTLLMPAPAKIAQPGQMQIQPASFWPMVPATGDCSLFKVRTSN